MRWPCVAHGMRNEVHIRLKCLSRLIGRCPFWNETSQCADSLESLFRKTQTVIFCSAGRSEQGSRH